MKVTRRLVFEDEVDARRFDAFIIINRVSEGRSLPTGSGTAIRTRIVMDALNHRCRPRRSTFAGREAE